MYTTNSSRIACAAVAALFLAAPAAPARADVVTAWNTRASAWA